MKGLDYFFEVDDYILVHAGLKFNADDPLKEKTAMLWIRDWYEEINHRWLNGRYIIHGHTPVFNGYIENQLHELELTRVLDIDNGCVFHSSGLGHLIAFELTNKELHFQACLD